MEKAEKMVGACEKQKEIIEGPTKTIFIEMPSISKPGPISLQCENWTDEMIREDPVAYEEVLFDDILMLVDRDENLLDYLTRLEAARAKLEAEAKGGDHD